MHHFIQFLLLLELINPAYAESIEAKSFVNNQQQQRYQALINEIRCPVCLGQSIGGSNAGLAKDLREKVRELILKQNTDDSIRKFMTDRYGDFVVFKPPVNKNTYLLWFAPFIFLALGLFFLMRSLSTQKSNVKSTVDTIKAKDLLK
ncbi:cytochrome c-type biogenesis protein CcmH [Candidatus Ruthia endofausta]|uniref:Cytochrome c-type biogenesis protein n=1 Tax=Candidatus Ruthia endofausta TaxID=2738852 RepID=A0A6N0HP06_9GAMM|nr:cytochrome c-type biogenesis protein [Candidatus Ruthia endofausta]QKQ24112.1 cytochrome c-type biogenesis protein CcmH [Candidatus Ruthia endofausta]